VLNIKKVRINFSARTAIEKNEFDLVLYPGSVTVFERVTKNL
jgi:hypothetical protein